MRQHIYSRERKYSDTFSIYIIRFKLLLGVCLKNNLLFTTVHSASWQIVIRSDADDTDNHVYRKQTSIVGTEIKVKCKIVLTYAKYCYLFIKLPMVILCRYTNKSLHLWQSIYKQLLSPKSRQHIHMCYLRVLCSEYAGRLVIRR